MAGELTDHQLGWRENIRWLKRGVYQQSRGASKI